VRRTLTSGPTRTEHCFLRASCALAFLVGCMRARVLVVGRIRVDSQEATSPSARQRGIVLVPQPTGAASVGLHTRCS
jgi:hypothetical protein